jgi:hypothetical protein
VGGLFLEDRLHVNAVPFSGAFFFFFFDKEILRFSPSVFMSAVCVHHGGSGYLLGPDRLVESDHLRLSALLVGGVSVVLG